MKVFLFVFAVLFTTTGISQKSEKPFFGETFLLPPKAIEMKGTGKNLALTLQVLPKTDTTFFELKPIAGLAYSFPNYQAQAVTGISYKHVKYTYQTETAPAKSYCDWSVNLVGSFGVTTQEDDIDGTLGSIGLGLGLYDNKVIICGLLNSYRDATDPTAKKRLKPVFAIMYTPF